MNPPPGWVQARLGEKCSIEIGGTPSRNVAEYWDEQKQTENVWVSIRDLNQRVITDTAEHISDLGVAHSNAKLQPEGTVLLSFKLTIGRVAFAGRKLYTNEAIAGLRSREIGHDFLYYGLQQWDLLRGVDQAIKGATLNKEKLKKIEVEYPTSRDEQEKIAEVLQTADRAIETTEALLAKQMRLQAGLVQGLLTCGLDKHGKLRSEETHKFKDSSFGRIPVEWGITTLERCVRSDSPICYGILMPGAHQDHGVPVIKVRDIVGGKVLLGDILLTDPKIDKQYERSRLRAGDLLITIRGTTGRIAVVPGELDGGNITQDTARIRLKEGYLNRYFYFLLQSKTVQDQVALHTLGQAVKGINIGEVRRIAFPVPEPNEQTEIANRLEKVKEGIDVLEANLAKLLAVKGAAMRDLLQGRKRVTALLEKGAVPEVVHAAQ